MTMQTMKRSAALMLAAVLMLSADAGALFGRKKAAQAPEGAPIAREVSITTYRDIPCRAQFLASDREGEDLTYAVVEPPRRGSVSVDGAEFVYTPKSGMTGGDRFTYTAEDSSGNVSLPATVTVTVEKTRSGVVYSDTADCEAAAAAQYLAEQGIFTGSRIGECYCFEPEKTVTRGEFVAMVLEMTGREVTDVTVTGFCDDGAIPAWAKGYASAGVREGIVRGSVTENGAAFRGADPVSFHEAAAILDRALEPGDVDLAVWYADREAVPSWAAQAVGNLEAASVLSAGSFGSAALAEPVTREAAAQMLCAAAVLLDADADGRLR